MAKPVETRSRQPAEAVAALDASLVVAVVSGIGTARLADRVLDGMQHLVPLAHCTVFAVNARLQAHVVSVASAYGDTAQKTAERFLGSGYDRLDPNIRWLTARRMVTKPSIRLSQHRADQIPDPAHRQACYGDTGIHGRVSLLIQAPEYRAVLSLYRSHAQGDFTSAHVSVIQTHAAFLMEALSAHIRATDAAQVQDAALERHLGALTLREREVIQQILRGRTTKQTARDMGLATATVNTYRYRAFRRLNIHREKELFALLGPADQRNASRGRADAA